MFIISIQSSSSDRSLNGKVVLPSCTYNYGLRKAYPLFDCRTSGIVMLRNTADPVIWANGLLNIDVLCLFKKQTKQQQKLWEDLSKRHTLSCFLDSSSPLPKGRGNKWIMKVTEAFVIKFGVWKIIYLSHWDNYFKSSCPCLKQYTLKDKISIFFHKVRWHMESIIHYQISISNGKYEL